MPLWGCQQRRTQGKVGVLFEERKPRNTTTTRWRRGRSREEPSPCHRGVAGEEARGRVNKTRKTCAVNFFCCRGVVGEEAPRSRATESEEGDED